MHLCSYCFSPQDFIASMWLFQRITKSQNGHGWKGCCQITCTSAPSWAGFLDSVAQECVQMAFGHVQGWKHQNLPGQPVISQYYSKKPFLVFKGNLQCFSLSPFLVFHHQKGPDSVPFAPLLQEFIQWQCHPLFSCLNSPRCLSCAS